MADGENEVIQSRFWRWVRIIGLSLAAVFLVGIASGFLAAHTERGGGFGLFPTAFLAGVALVLAGVIWLLLRNVVRPTGEEPLTPKERLNRNILIGSGLIGGIMAVVMVFASRDELTPGSVFSNAPLPFGVALALVVVTVLLVPALSIYWHRTAVDEQEADAYKSGALLGLYVYMIGAPAWWFAWRGGFAPEPNGVVIFFATTMTVLIVWFWKKYR